MTRYLAGRLGQGALTLFFVSIVVFVGVRAIPGDPVSALAGPDASPEVLEALREQYGLDQPVHVQYWHYLKAIFHGDLGRSMASPTSVVEMILGALPVTIELALIAAGMSVIVGMAFGTIAAFYRRGPVQWSSNFLSLLGLSVPSFWLALMSILLLATIFPVFPASGYVSPVDSIGANLKHMFLPAAVLASGLAAVLVRQTRSAVIETLSADFVRTARAKGLYRRRILFAHVLRNSLSVIVTVIGLQLGFLLAGAVVTEQIFVVPGFGRLMISSVLQRDYPVIQGVVLVSAVGYVLINIIVDVLYTFIDPRVRIAKGDGS